ncbi:TetR/AcrR family transcriptional regulator C-terminal ligand-binding domain-containing protein [Dactylosporangium aurantiacum]|uniref:TetR/AcrR family transcriptional regulator C-terminal ligand-binding domain-containing protein n=1 Tax=Dactylosporangium aurantiacum TaxID=35754 RepID=A0A9Q9MDN8_9ACTN|nr:TetR/AcrR family transcriptional regulator [Dactylosporangium aurantiacum]MDG6106480.1 TetR/AcrR family transcriptional regulator C-terminal ligand-binding domain-containing protein [Dactylosporangium aurantiacum]UWZ50485.1 TetR/AcrR family transcriptional regulator C-terminal ligand-binding domain-containing protein [Dactylosporangium aurantiacum]
MTRPGRPAGPTTDTETVVLTAALDLLLSEGAAALTAQRLHQVTGVSRSTVYRHWPTPAAVLAALIDVAPTPPAPPSGDLARDLHAAVDQLCDRLRDRPVGAFLQALIVAAAADPSTAQLRHRYVGDLLTPFHTVLRTAGVPATDREDAVAAIVSPLLLDALLLDRPAARTRAHRIVDTVARRLDPASEAEPA